MACWLTRDADRRLREIESTSHPNYPWPESCEGAAKAWLMFVGPSPGGDKPESRWPRGTHTPLHDEVWWQPVLEWSPGFRKSILPLAESIVGRSFRESGKLYAIANFDHVNSPAASDVLLENMKEGVPAVLEVLQRARPRIIVPMTKRCSDLLTTSLKEWLGANLVHTQVNHDLWTSRKRKRKYRPLDTWQIDGSSEGSLADSLIVRLPQHPAHIFTEEDAREIGKTIHSGLGSIGLET